jgi:hypothetical protein
MADSTAYVNGTLTDLLTKQIFNLRYVGLDSYEMVKIDDTTWKTIATDYLALVNEETLKQLKTNTAYELNVTEIKEWVELVEMGCKTKINFMIKLHKINNLEVLVKSNVNKLENK